MSTQLKYPEHEKMQAVHEKTQQLGAFLEWLESDGRHIATMHEHMQDCGGRPVQMFAPGHDGAFLGAIGRECGMLDSSNSQALEVFYTWEPPSWGNRIERILALYFDIDLEKIQYEKEQIYRELRTTNV